MEKKIDVIGQMILAAIPILIASMYAFYRIKKFKRGMLVILADLAIDLVILTSYGDINWNELYNEEEPTMEMKPVTFTPGGLMALLVDILLPVYFARKWTMEYNERIGTSAS